MLKEKQHKNTVRNFIQEDHRDSQELESPLSAIKVIKAHSSVVDIQPLQANHIFLKPQFHMLVLSQAHQ